MTTLVGFKRNKEVVVAWDRQTTTGNIKSFNNGKGIRFKQVSEGIDREWFMACCGSATAGIILKNVTKKFLSKEDRSPLELSEEFVEEFEGKFEPYKNEGYLKSIAIGAILGSKDGLFTVECDFGVYEADEAFQGSGGQLAQGVYEALKNTKISNMQLLKRIYGIVGKLDAYTSEEFLTNIAG